MPKLIDLTHKRFGRLSVVERDCTNKSKNAHWICECDCGNYCIVSGYNLTRELTKSCGCYCSDLAREAHYKHGKNKSRLHNIWSGMKTRCYNPNRKDYKNYGGRGIEVCGEWLNDFQSFYYWAIDNGYRDDLTIDRIDVNGDYATCNCRWVTLAEQAANKRNTKRK